MPALEKFLHKFKKYIMSLLVNCNATFTNII